jgi:hypothetical protein
MRRAADAAVEASEGRRAAAAAASAAPSAGALPLSAEEWAAVAREAFPAGDGNDYRHLRLADFSDAVAALPREEVAAAMEGGGGLGGVQVGARHCWVGRPGRWLVACAPAAVYGGLVSAWGVGLTP